MDASAIQKLYHDSQRSAEKAGLTFVDHQTLQSQASGYFRIKHGSKSFIYKNAKGRTVKDASTLKRLKALAIPPAWNNVWIAPSPKAHIQVIGTDSKGNKQYLYHEKWSTFREKLKFDRLIDFSYRLPILRKTIKHELNTPGLSRRKIISAALALMDELAIRIGNEAYAEENKTYGLTTLRDRHVTIHKDEITLHFIGKSHKEHDFEVHDKQLAKVVKASQDIRGSHLFQYLDKGHKKHPLTSTEVNAFIKKVMGEHFTAKDFRMWAATAHAYSLMKEECAQATKAKQSKKSLKRVISCVAEKLGNTPAVCKAHYIHTDLQQKFEDGTFAHIFNEIKKSKPSRYMKADELELRLFLEKIHGR